MGLMKPPEDPPENANINTLLAMAEEPSLQPADVDGNPDDWLIGMTPELAEVTLRSKGFRFRIYKRQGVTCMVTADYCMTRFNVGVDADGIITEVFGRG